MTKVFVIDIVTIERGAIIIKKYLIIILIMAMLTMNACGSQGGTSDEISVTSTSFRTQAAVTTQSNTTEKNSATSTTSRTQAASTTQPVSVPSANNGKAGTLSSFETVDVNGTTRDESIFAGHKLTMINIWATYCGPCLNEMPNLGQLSAEYADKGVQIVGIVLDVRMSDGKYNSDKLQEAKELIELTGATYMHLLPSDNLNNAVLDSVNAVPTTIFVNEKGNTIGEAYVGSKNKESWIKIIDTVLAEVDSQ